MNTNFEKFKRDFKQDLLVKVIVAMRHGKISRANSSYIAKRILEIFSGEEKPQGVFAAINKLAEIHPNILEILIKRGREYDNAQRIEDISQIQIYLKGGVN